MNLYRWKGRGGATLVGLNSMCALHRRPTSPRTVGPCQTRLAMTLYSSTVGVREEALVLNSRSACRSCVLLCAVQASPSLVTILPEEDPARIHVGHRDHIFCGKTLTISVRPFTIRCEVGLRTAVLRTPHERYPVLASIVVETEFCRGTWTSAGARQ